MSIISSRLRRSAVVTAGALLFAAAALPAAARPGPDGFADLAEKLLPSVVNISTTQTVKPESQSEKSPGHSELPQGSPFEEFFKDFFDHNGQPGERPQLRPRKATSLGSGFIIDASGYIVTNNHVITDADQITVILHDDTNLKAEVVGRDTKTDVAVLKVKTEKPLPVAAWGDSDKSRVGDWVLAIGNPFGLGGSVTAGILSARQRDINSGPYDDFLQTDAAINRGNSGGPMFNMDGQVIGINTAIYSPNGGSVGIGFAVPSNVANKVVAALEEHGKVERGWLGVQIQPVTPAIASSLGLKTDHGALVAVVTAGSPSAAAGLKQGDVILAFNGEDITKLRDLPHDVAGSNPGTNATLTVWRDGKQQQVDVKLGEMPANPQVASAQSNNNDEGPPPTESSVTPLGLRLAPLTTDFRHDLHLGR
ncbi:MAG TPA: Do family serine endopeptidase, partial [Stellaceae bacterium]|nr:Do family serine endopeptidase [Stellaceae bacterium]